MMGNWRKIYSTLVAANPAEFQHAGPLDFSQVTPTRGQIHSPFSDHFPDRVRSAILQGILQGIGDNHLEQEKRICDANPIFCVKHIFFSAEMIANSSCRTETTFSAFFGMIPEIPPIPKLSHVRWRRLLVYPVTVKFQQSWWERLCNK